MEGREKAVFCIFLVFDYLKPLPKHNPVMLYYSKCFIPFSSPLDHECLIKQRLSILGPLANKGKCDYSLNCR